MTEFGLLWFAVVCCDLPQVQNIHNNYFLNWIQLNWIHHSWIEIELNYYIKLQSDRMRDANSHFKKIKSQKLIQVHNNPNSGTPVLRTVEPKLWTRFVKKLWTWIPICGFIFLKCEFTSRMRSWAVIWCNNSIQFQFNSLNSFMMNSFLNPELTILDLNCRSISF